MKTLAAAEPLPNPTPPSLVSESQSALSREWRRLTRVATLIAILTSPSVFYWYHHHNGWGVFWSLVATFFTIVAFRGVVDVIVRRVIPWPSLFGTDDVRLREDDVVNRRRAWTWNGVVRKAFWIFGILTAIYLVKLAKASPGTSVSYFGTIGHILHTLGRLAQSQAFWMQIVVVFFLFFANFFIFMGPLLLMGISQIRGYEPGDAEWGVKLDDVRGQAEAKEEVRRVVTLWQSGEVFEKAGGKRERGLLFLGAPGTGKTMLAKAIATGFNSPFVSIPGSGFAQTFIGIDAIIVRFLARKAKRLARKWGGQCIVFIDEIDAVGMRRQALQGQGGGTMTPGVGAWQPEFYGPWGAINPSGDLIIESPAWREWIFEQRAPARRSPYPAWFNKLNEIVNQGVFPGMFGGGMGQLALNQLLVTMDGIDNPPFFRRMYTSRINSFLDAVYVVPRRLGKTSGRIFAIAMMILGACFFVEGVAQPFHISTLGAIFIAAAGLLAALVGVNVWRGVSKNGTASLRMPPPRPTGAQIYFIGATNVPMQNLDPALTRPGRMGRHVQFRTPTKEDRKDIFDLYLGKVAHDPALDTPERRDEIARITNGYSPAMIDQICSMALTNAHHEGKLAFEWSHLVDAMTVIEAGSAVNVKYTEEDARAVAIHEAGHAAAAHVYRPDLESSRLSIKMRAGSLGHHQAFEKEERFGAFQSRMFGALLHTIGAMAAEFAFYGENSVGVGGDLQSVTWTASMMVGAAGMSPLPLDLHGKTFADETEEQTRERIQKRFEDIGIRLLNRTASPQTGDPTGAVLADPRKRAFAAQFIGQAFVTAYNLMEQNKQKVERVANAVMDKKEIYGDELVRLLDAQRFEKPELDWTDEKVWPAVMNWSKLDDNGAPRKGRAARGRKAASQGTEA
ncbi:MAG TPA: AAA family ATPase [Gaiellaceae bacterium]|nr:AAA family ATPase [Gaiellaceae bacterium]